MESLWTILGLGFLLGLRHALDADHVVAVSTIVAQTRNLTKAALIGIFWGAGHTATLGLVGLVVLFGKFSIPESLAQAGELLVGIVLVLLGATTLWRLRRRRLHLHPHRHGALEHVHFHSHARDLQHDHEHPQRFGWKPLLVGMTHGLAGSAALMLLVLSTVRSIMGGLLYITVFGVGSIGGMLLVSLVLGLPIVWAARSSSPVLKRAHQVITCSAGLASLAFGLGLIAKITYVP
ncbi:MAG: urease accessory protein UreH [Anaerolineae bacterium]